MTNMKAILLLDERHILDPDVFVELVVWRVANPPVRGSAYAFKYRLALVVGGECVVRFDNESGKGDHRHLREKEFPYEFSSPDRLLSDFWREVDEWRKSR
ncbi:MAG TPA: DUF6516 family protein [Candidatus Deferrimicrobiaceae bacterium]